MRRPGVLAVAAAVACATLAALAIGAAAQDPSGASGAAAPAPDAAPAIDAATAKTLIAENCSTCHARDIVDQQRLTQAQWGSVLKKMKGWGATIEAEKLEPLAAHLAAARGPAAALPVLPVITAAAADEALRPLPDGTFAGGDASEGKRIFAEACSACHGDDAHGGEIGTNLVDRPLLRRAPEFAKITRAGKGDMPAFELKDAEIASLLAWLRKVEP
ncbi:MAG: cytochrome c [Acidobacteria bacterium]|nr:cytochrome c [Acidobacteriota bacterium]